METDQIIKDQTINAKFELRVYSRLWGRDAVFQIQRTAAGWYVPTPFYTGGLCDQTCSPHLYTLLRHAGIRYPGNIGRWFSWLWAQAKEKGLSYDAVQQGINDIAKWIDDTDRIVPPVDNLWKGIA